VNFVDSSFYKVIVTPTGHGRQACWEEQKELELFHIFKTVCLWR